VNMTTQRDVAGFSMIVCHAVHAASPTNAGRWPPSLPATLSASAKRMAAAAPLLWPCGTLSHTLRKSVFHPMGWVPCLCCLLPCFYLCGHLRSLEPQPHSLHTQGDLATQPGLQTAFHV
jgi:hypothetical protein